jgi:hypothetical protein
MNDALGPPAGGITHCAVASVQNRQRNPEQIQE